MQILQKTEINRIIRNLNENQIVVLKTDTVFGLMAKANKENEIKINKLKRSNINKKISIIFPDKENVYNYIENLSTENKKLIEEKLPGKYTFIVNLKKFSNFERKDFGIRITANNYLQHIVKQTGPLLATSVNITGETPMNNIQEIIEKFQNTDIVVVEDEKSENKPSTIIDIRYEKKIIRR